MDAEYSSPRKRGGQTSSSISDDLEDNPAVAGLLRTIQKPLSTIGRIFSDDGAQRSGGLPSSLPTPSPRLSPAVFQTPRNGGGSRRSDEAPRGGMEPPPVPKRLDAEEAAARQANAEAAEAQRLQRAEHKDVVE